MKAASTAVLSSSLNQNKVVTAVDKLIESRPDLLPVIQEIQELFVTHFDQVNTKYQLDVYQSFIAADLVSNKRFFA